MPKEIIDCRHTSGIPLAIEVAWGRDQRVQVASVNRTEGIDSHSTEAGWHPSLDREAVNKLIRTLRRARDQAYGPDA